jgi:hypothetical protein
MVFLCKRCGRVLKSVKSIKLGYGPTCYRITKFHDTPVNIHEEIKFLKINMTEVIHELKSRFQSCNGDVRSLLKPIQIETHLIEKTQLAIV